MSRSKLESITENKLLMKLDIKQKKNLEKGIDKAVCWRYNVYVVKGDKYLRKFILYIACQRHVINIF